MTIRIEWDAATTQQELATYLSALSAAEVHVAWVTNMAGDERTDRGMMIGWTPDLEFFSADGAGIFPIDYDDIVSIEIRGYE